MRKKSQLSLNIVLCILLAGCCVSEPEEEMGKIRIQAGAEVLLSKAADTIDSVHCVLSKGMEPIYSGDRAKQGTQFVIEIEDLEPGDDYSVLILGKNSAGDVVGRGARGDVEVSAEEWTQLNVTWERFNPTLLSPTDGSTQEDQTPAFDWSDAAGASSYSLEADDSDDFSDPVISESNLIMSSFTPATGLDLGTYHWRVKSKDIQGNWSGWSETWSFTVATGSIALLSPNGGELWLAGEEREISWNSAGTSGTVRIAYSTNSGTDWVEVVPETEDNGSYSWTVPATPSAACLVKISDADGFPEDRSDNPFAIGIEAIAVTSPNGGEIWYAGEVHDITWTSSGTSGNVKLDYSTDSGSNWNPILTSTADDGSHPWNVPVVKSDDCLVRVADADGSFADQSDGPFTLGGDEITILTPNGGEILYSGETAEIKWTSHGTSGTVIIEYSTSAGSSWTLITSNTENDGSYDWIVPDTPSSDCLILITDSDGIPEDESDDSFEIQKIEIVVVSPNDGETWFIGETQNITWTSSGTSGTVAIEYTTNGGSNWISVTSGTEDDGSYTWTVPNTPSNNCKIKVLDADGSPEDQSDSAFWITDTETGVITDIDGNVYHTIRLGDQWWMLENLRVTRFRNGDPIPLHTDSASWKDLYTPAYCEYENDSKYTETYGLYYNMWAMLDKRKIAPIGWHVPTDEEWKKLEMFLGMSQEQADSVGTRGTGIGGKLKEKGVRHWFSPNAGATNSSGFTALAAGHRDFHGDFNDLFRNANFWTCTKFNLVRAWGRRLYYDVSGIRRKDQDGRNAYSIRCVRDR